ncbi:MAG: M28 family peptidase [Rhodothermales bacterium]|nr:M28 family peptidase [Rhodothermales bacterium]
MRLLCLTLLLAATAATAQPRPATDSLARIQTARADVDTLASPRYAGRGYDRHGGAGRAAGYLSRRFAAIGLAPFGRSFLRPFTFVTSVVDGASLSVDGHELPLHAAFLPIPSAPDGWGAGEVTTVGHGLALPDHNAYAGRSVRGRIAVVTDPLPDPLPSTLTEPRADLIARIAAAKAYGAQALVILVDPAHLVYGAPRVEASLPVFFVARAAWPANAQTVSYHVEARPNQPVAGVNVVGFVPGTVHPDSFVVVTAHYDHIGTMMTGPGLDRAIVRPGANDNASGTASLLALAEAVRRTPLRVSVVFAAMAAEELGLVGSDTLAARPPWPLDRTRLLVNLDMTASGDGRIIVFGGQDQPEAFARLQHAAASVHATPAIALIPRETRPNSDHWPFAQKGVPALFLLTAGRPQPYHAPDDLAATLDWPSWDAVHRLVLTLLRSE